MKSSTPKVLFDVCGVSSLDHVLRAARVLGAVRILVVAAEDAPAVHTAAKSAGAEVVVQSPALGTGHAVKLAFAALAPDAGDVGDVLVLCGDGPLYSVPTLEGLLRRHRERSAAETLLTATVADPHGLGRVVRGSDGRPTAIVEELEADAPTRAIREINTGIAALRADAVRGALAKLRNDNKKGEYYLTDLVALLLAEGRTVEAASVADPREALSYNSIEELAAVRAEMRRRIVVEHMANGVDVVDPATAWIDVDVAIGAGTRILPCTVIARGVSIGRDCVVGPFATLRTDTRLDDTAEIGNFVEVKKSRIGKGSKAKHLTYLGDATIGERVNVGCGTITANYDGKKKHPTKIGDGAFIGSGTVLVAPAEVGSHALTGAGAIVRPGHTIGAAEVWVGVPARKLEDASKKRRGEVERTGGAIPPAPQERTK